MNILFSTVPPVFALIRAGWLARRCEWIGPSGALELNRFVIYLGIPALLFQSMAKASWRDLNQPGFIAAFGLGCAAVFAVTLLARRVQGVALADASLDGLNVRLRQRRFHRLSLVLSPIPGPAWCWRLCRPAPAHSS